MPFLIRLLVNAAALWVATRLVPGVSFDGGALPFLGVALVFGVINAFIRPVLKILTFPLTLLTLGLFWFVINALMLKLASALLAPGFQVRTFTAAFLGAIVLSLVNVVLKWLVHPTRDRN